LVFVKDLDCGPVERLTASAAIEEVHGSSGLLVGVHLSTACLLVVGDGLFDEGGINSHALSITNAVNQLAFLVVFGVFVCLNGKLRGCAFNPKLSVWLSELPIECFEIEDLVGGQLLANSSSDFAP